MNNDQHQEQQTSHKQYICNPTRYTIFDETSNSQKGYKKNARRCNAAVAASAQNGLGCHNILHIWEYSGTKDRTITSLQEKGTHNSKNWLLNWNRIINLCILYKQKLILISQMQMDYWDFRMIQKWNNRKQRGNECLWIPTQLHNTDNRKGKKQLWVTKRRSKNFTITQHNHRWYKNRNKSDQTSSFKCELQSVNTFYKLSTSYLRIQI